MTNTEQPINRRSANLKLNQKPTQQEQLINRLHSNELDPQTSPHVLRSNIISNLFLIQTLFFYEKFLVQKKIKIKN